jgi:hypothetical protein
MAIRRDLLLELDTTFSGTGTYTSDWFDSSAIQTVALVYYFGGTSQPTVTLEEGIDGTNALWSVDFPGAGGGHVASGTVTVAARYFRLTATGAQANAAFKVSLRALS